jgi:hypothetical protein
MGVRAKPRPGTGLAVFRASAWKLEVTRRSRNRQAVLAMGKSWATTTRNPMFLFLLFGLFLLR